MTLANTVLLNVVYFWSKIFFQLKQNHFLLFLFFAFCVISCNKCSQKNSKAVVLVTQSEQVNKEVAKLIETQLNNADTLKLLILEGDSLYATKQIIEFYRKNNFNPVWTNKGKRVKQSDTLLELIKNAEDYGLVANDYHVNQIVKFISDEKDSTIKKYDILKISEFDILMTDAFFTFAVHINKGRLNPASLKREWKVAKLNINLVDVLTNAIQQNTIRAAIDLLEPVNKQYIALKTGLKSFKMEFKNSTWDSLFKPEFDTLTFKERLKKRLVASHNYVNENKTSDSIELINAVKNLQCRHNLTEDGNIGLLTYKALQQTKQDYIRQIEINMERWRYYDEPKENKYVWINIPKYEMRVIEKDTLVMKSKVIVGASKTPTPVLKSTIRYFIIYPYWKI